MVIGVDLGIIGFLEQDVRADIGGLELLVVLYRGRSDVDIDASNFAFVDFGVIDGLDTVEDVVDVTFFVVFSGLQGNALVAEPDDGLSLGADLVLGQLAAVEFIAALITAIAAFVDTMVTDIKRRKNDDALAVDGFLDLAGDVEQPLQMLGLGQFQQHGNLMVGQAGKRSGLLENAVDFLFAGVSRLGQGLADVRWINEADGLFSGFLDGHGTPLSNQTDLRDMAALTWTPGIDPNLPVRLLMRSTGPTRVRLITAI